MECSSNQAKILSVTPRFDVESLPVVPTGLVSYALQVGGHGSSTKGTSSDIEARILKHPLKNILYKSLPRDARSIFEANFYLEVFDENAPSSVVSLRPFLSAFHGVHKSNTPSRIYLALEDILHDLKNPSVCDLKMGQSSSPPEASEAKIASENAKYAHRSDVGFLFTGMKIYDKQTLGYLTVPRLYGRSLNKEQVYTHAIRPFLSSDLARCKRRASAFLREVKMLRSWMSSAPFAFFCSSLLLAYGDDDSDNIVFRLVDFAHVRHSLPSHHPDPSGFVHGLDVLAEMLEKATNDTASQPSDIPWSVLTSG